MEYGAGSAGDKRHHRFDENLQMIELKSEKAKMALNSQNMVSHSVQIGLITFFNFAE